ncbi:hypothetical protein [Vibrio phage JSF7]|uniref:Uncharacterized protein n=1 Tax=Vibrio phage JSF7 TaxID=1292086 RepID=A0A240EWV8_9CAUD|nr:hypothetical protein HOQ92_gp26 [Vibrio phage JSF7]APD18150.1 hypothetical protein [Vibrio phage JSF7]
MPAAILMMIKRVGMNLLMSLFGEKMLENLWWWFMDYLVKRTPSEDDDKKLEEWKASYYEYKNSKKV